MFGWILFGVQYMVMMLAMACIVIWGSTLSLQEIVLIGVAVWFMLMIWANVTR